MWRRRLPSNQRIHLPQSTVPLHALLLYRLHGVQTLAPQTKILRSLRNFRLNLGTTRLNRCNPSVISHGKNQIQPKMVGILRVFRLNKPNLRQPTALPILLAVPLLRLY